MSSFGFLCFVWFKQHPIVLFLLFKFTFICERSLALATSEFIGLKEGPLVASPRTKLKHVYSYLATFLFLIRIIIKCQDGLGTNNSQWMMPLAENIQHCYYYDYFPQAHKKVDDEGLN